MTTPNPADLRMAAAGAAFFAARRPQPKPTDTPIFRAVWNEQHPPIPLEED